MEKDKTGFWRFDEGEKECLHRVFIECTHNVLKARRKDKKEIEQFIGALENVCSAIKSCLNNPGSDTVKDHRNEALKVFKEALLFTEKIRSGKKHLWDLSGMPLLGDHSPYDRENPRLYRDENNPITYLVVANALKQPLKAIVALLENDLNVRHREGRGRLQADSRNFIKNIARVYRRHIGKPTDYRYGPFQAVVSVALEAVGLPSKAPDRAVKAALKG